MNLSKKLSVTLIASCMSAASFADPITLYGRVNVSVQSTDEGEGQVTELKSNNSRLGVKGKLDLENDLEVLYVAEWRVDFTDESGSDNFSARNQYVGLRGGFGTVLLGRNDTVLKQTQGNIDQFNHYEADIKALWQGENRMGDSITYFSPKFNGVTFGASYIAQDEVTGHDAQSYSIAYGDKNLKNSRWYAAIAADFYMKGYDTQRMSFQTKFADLVLGAILHNQKSIATGDSKTGALVSAAYSISKVVLKGQLQSLKDDNSVTIGLDYKLGKATKAFTWFTYTGVQGTADKAWLAAGLEHKF
ncbi:porin [uncultured Paraglaciecola sp.]|uniref:porin n=1 Tax=uncultured Paraglaciecola sp. TaxID=1765024 RepID=UPI0030DD9037